jgi:hypothetical protein
MTGAMRRALALAAAVAGCAQPAAPAVRFANAPAVDAVNDRRDVPRPPRSRTVLPELHYLDGYESLLTRPLELRRARRALGVNALDEVPDSTWFTSRIGVRDLTPDEIRRGPAVVGSPEPHKPWTIHSTKIGGAAVGFIMTDARGEKFLLKLELPGHPEVETGAAAVANRLLWAAGYNVPEDHVVYVRERELVLAPDAKIKDVFGRAQPLGREDLARRLAPFDRDREGRLRALASHVIEGELLGGHPGVGVRADDPNDRIPHELRRDLRGAYALFSWLDLTDVKEDNTLDAWVADPGDPARHYVKHYLVDFGKGLGATALFARDLRRGGQYVLDVPSMLTSLATLGLQPRRWERRVAPGLRGVGLFDAETYDPGAWKPDTPAYLPFRTADAYDKLWASKIIMRFTREQLRAAVDAARYSDPRAADYVVEALVARQRATARHWFWRVSPLDRFELAQDRLCFDDLMLVHRLAPVVGTTRYTITAHDQQGRPVGAPLVRWPDETGRSCVGPIPLSRAADAYTILRVDTARLDFRGTTYVHVARGRGSERAAPRVIGVWRP